MNNTGLLYKTKVYTIGSMEYGNGQAWRNELKEAFKPLSICVLDPYNKQFVKTIDESDEQREILFKLRASGDFEGVARHAKEFRAFDLACVDKSDFVVWHLDTTIPTIGSVEEFSWAVRLKRPSYVVVRQGKEKCPLWIFGMIPHKYIFSSLKEFTQEIYDLDSGKKELDNRWRLFDLDIR